MNDILSAIYRNLLESRFSASLSCPDYRRAIIRVEQCMDELRQALPAEEQELPEQFWDACSALHLMDLEVLFQVTWTAAPEI